MRMIHRKKDGTIEIKYYCLLKDGTSSSFTAKQIVELRKKDLLVIDPITEVDRLRRIKSGRTRIRDGFKPHKSFATGEWIETKRQQKEHDKRHGLIAEAGEFKSGGEYLSESKKGIKKDPYLTDDTFVELARHGLKVTDNEAKELQESEAKGTLEDSIFIEKSDTGSSYTKERGDKE